MSKQNRKRGQAGQRADLRPLTRDQKHPSDRHPHDNDRPLHQPDAPEESDQGETSPA